MSVTMERADIFHCERFHCSMLKIRCVERQNKKHSGFGCSFGETPFVTFPECQGCEQGIRIRCEVDATRMGVPGTTHVWVMHAENAPGTPALAT
jgi:hypothetical protein